MFKNHRSRSFRVTLVDQFEERKGSLFDSGSHPFLERVSVCHSIRVSGPFLLLRIVKDRVEGRPKNGVLDGVQS